MGLYSRRIVGWSMSRWINRHLVIDALRMAIDARQPKGALIHHSEVPNIQATTSVLSLIGTGFNAA